MRVLAWFFYAGRAHAWRRVPDVRVRLLSACPAAATANTHWLTTVRTVTKLWTHEGVANFGVKWLPLGRPAHICGIVNVVYL